MKASDPLGVYGVKEGIRMRSSENPSLNIDWEGFNRNDRRGAMRRALNLKVSLTEMLSVNYKPLLHCKASIMNQKIQCKQCCQDSSFWREQFVNNSV